MLQASQTAAIVFAAALVLFLPGLAWLTWFPGEERDFPSRLADAAALSIALTAVAALALFVLKIRMGGLAVAGIYGLLALAAASGWLRRPPRWHRHLLPAALTVLAVALAVGWRLYQARSLVLPAWVDSVHHVLIVELFLQNGGIPANFSPYLPASFSYHYAFHALAALFTWASGLDPAHAVLIFGQILNALASLAVYRLARSIWPGASRAVIAAALAVFAFQMPAYYLTWGRYTLLTGLAVLPPAMACALGVLRSPVKKEHVIRLGVLVAGAILAHYLGALLLAFFIAILALFWLASFLRGRQADRSAWAALTASAALGFLLALPWVLRVFQYNQGSITLQVNLTADAPDKVYFSNYLNYLWYLAGPRRNYYLLLLGLLGALLTLLPRQAPASRRLAAWWLAVILLTLPWGLRLGPFRPDHFAIVWFLPASLFAGHLLLSAAEAARRRLPLTAARLLPAAAGIALLAWGLVDTANILNPATVFVTRADTDALAWINTNTPPNARFWINTTPWQGGTYRGVNGGWWITPVTGRGTLLPVVFYATASREYSQQINGWAAVASSVTECSEDFYQVIDEANLDYVYLRQGTGSLQPQALEGCSGLEEVYQAEGVVIYQVGNG